ncbi:cyanidin-3-o-glucoside 2-o-glucuronosyltransferase [Quercus suber]|uniref:Cyanidin-3-o-glucoside 2-o-glucuronosyltransferase n=1 Tax=Quercus suber TaxID=58331 RepID=A0AAW0LKY1_QUESU
MESMKFGVPIIAMPMHLDQPVNARLVEAIGAGVEVKRDKKGRLEREEVAKVIRKVLVENTTKRKAKELKENIENKGDEEIVGVAMDMASPNITTILTQLKPDLVIYDFLQILAPSLAQSQNIPAVNFVVMSATIVSFYMHLANNPGIEYPSPEIYLQDHEVGKFANDTDDGDRILECFQQSSEIVLIKTFQEIEAKHIDYLSIRNEQEKENTYELL